MTRAQLLGAQRLSNDTPSRTGTRSKQKCGRKIRERRGSSAGMFSTKYPSPSNFATPALRTIFALFLEACRPNWQPSAPPPSLPFALSLGRCWSTLQKQEDLVPSPLRLDHIFLAHENSKLITVDFIWRREYAKLHSPQCEILYNCRTIFGPNLISGST